MDVESLLDTKKVARRLGISVQAVHRLCDRGTLSSLWLNGGRLFRKDVIEAYERDEAAQKRRFRLSSSAPIVRGGRGMSVEAAVEDARSRKGAQP